MFGNRVNSLCNPKPWGAQVVITYNNPAEPVDYWWGKNTLIYTFWLADYQNVCAYLCVCPHFGPELYSIGGVMMCLCTWVLAHLWSRRLYNSICPPAKSGWAPKHWHNVKERGRDLHRGQRQSPSRYQNSIYTSSFRTTLIHLLSFIIVLQSIKVWILTAAEKAKVQF